MIKPVQNPNHKVWFKVTRKVSWFERHFKWITEVEQDKLLCDLAPFSIFQKTRFTAVKSCPESKWNPHPHWTETHNHTGTHSHTKTRLTCNTHTRVCDHTLSSQEWDVVFYQKHVAVSVDCEISLYHPLTFYWHSDQHMLKQLL